jgi:hypothetical protein
MLRVMGGGLATLALAAAFSGPAAAAAGPQPPVSVRPSLPPGVGFATPVTAHVVVVLRRDAVESDRARIATPIAPLTLLEPTHVSRASRGDVDVVTVELRAACLDQRCVSATGVRRLVLPSVEVEVPGRDGTPITAKALWPRLAVRGRVTAADMARSPLPFRADLGAPRVSYRVSPSALTAVLVVLAASLALIAVVLAGQQVVRSERRRHIVVLTDLQRALALARSSETRSAPDRRRALGLLARVLGAREDRLATATSALAWSAPSPTPGSTSDLVDEVERELVPR